MKLKVLLTTIICAFLASVNLSAADTAPTNYNAYDGFAPGARAVAMGGAFCAVSDDPSAVYYNPAGLADIERAAVAITYEATRQSDLTTQQIFAGEPLQSNNLQQLSFVTSKGAFSWRPMSNSIILTQNGQDWSNSEVKINAYTLSAANKSNTELSIGLNVTYLTGLIALSKIENGIPTSNISDGYGVATDLSFLYTPTSEVRFGMNLKNLAGFMWWQDFEKDLLPFTLLTGIDFQIKKFTNFSVQWDKKYYRRSDEENITRFGLEQWLGTTLALRGGISGTDLNNKDKASLSAGLGYSVNNLQLSLTGEKYRVDKIDVYRYLMSINILI